MNEMKYEVRETALFKKDYRLAKKRGKNIQLLRDVVLKLANGQPLSEKHYDHILTGNWLGFRECHIAPDWLLVYQRNDAILTLTLMRTGSHSDLRF